MAKTRDLYQVLGVAKTATADEIRSAYKKLARKHHPDVNPGNADAEKRFKEISAAYDVLGDKEKRAAYDEFGEDAMRSGFDPDKARAYQRWQSDRAAGGVPFSTEQVDFDLGDLFGDLGGFGGFGGVGGFDRATAPHPSRSRGSDVHAVAELDLEQAIRGSEVSVDVPTDEPCTSCRGSGRAPNTDVARCGTCGGTGKQRVAQGPLNMVSSCRDCGGRGERFVPCRSCQGAGRTRSSERVKVRIPPGADDGSTLRIAGKGSGGAARGDLVIETRIRPHPWLRRDGLDLTMRLPVTVAEAYNGAKVEVPTFDGPVSLKIPPRSQTGQKLRLRGRGVKRGNKKGDLLVELDVRLPDRQDSELAKALRESENAYSQPVRSELRL